MYMRMHGICRRYSDFRALFLLLRPLGLPLGSFPGRSLRTSEDFLAKRCAGLGTWVQRVVAAIGPIAGQASALEPFFLEQRDVLPGEVLKASGAAVHLVTATLEVQSNVSIGKLMLKLRDEADETAASPAGGSGMSRGIEPELTPAAHPAASPQDVAPDAQPTSKLSIPVTSSSDTPLAVAQAAGIGRASAVAVAAGAAAASGRLAVSPPTLLSGSKASSSNPLNAFGLLRVLGQVCVASACASPAPNAPLFAHATMHMSHPHSHPSLSSRAHLPKCCRYGTSPQEPCTP